jgi:5'-deoxynucleotidase YfbR-like HD superfamily hydrolase
MTKLEPKVGVVGASCVTHSGKYFDFLEPTAEQIDVEDIAWGLAHICRFGGQTARHFYSVAQHCVLVAWLVEQAGHPELMFAALMHDAAEAYVGDMVGPLKQLCPDFKAVEKRVEEAIAAKFGLTLPWGPIIKHADLRALRTEQRDLTAAPGDSWSGLDEYAPWDFAIRPLTPYQAYDQFRTCFEEWGT